MGHIQITVDGDVALTAGLLAAELGIDPASARRAIHRAGLQPIEHLDARTPLYAADTARAALRERPGRGSNLRGHT